LIAMLARTALICTCLVTLAHADNVAMSTDLLFGVGEATLTAQGKDKLDSVAKGLAASTTEIGINAYTDTTAPDNDHTGAYQLKLSKDRATAVMQYLAKKGIAAKRMTAVGFGAQDPIATNETDEGKAQNRRIELIVQSEVRAPVAKDLAAYLARIPGKGALIATINTSEGALHCTLFEQETPATVANFVGLATGQKAWTDPRNGLAVKGKPFYDGLAFHRVIPGFMVQGGDPLGRGTGGPGYAFNDEINPQRHHVPGTLAMANAGPNTNGSQFFIDEVEVAHLDGHYSIFGQCAEIAVITRIANVPRDHGDKPANPVVIRSVSIARAER
jgi:peptidyl-prolyl cis-trans isomerase A (cyclophilin A)